MIIVNSKGDFKRALQHSVANGSQCNMKRFELKAKEIASQIEHF